MQRKQIKFEDHSAFNTTSPWKTPRKSSYQDLILHPEYQERRLRFLEGETWMRILPPLEGSVHGWFIPLQVLEFEGGMFVHPRSLTRNAKCAFDHAYAWALKHHPESLYSKTNPKGVRLLPDPKTVFWAAVEEGGKTVARVFLGSGYNGSRGGAPGLGWEIWKLSQDTDEEGKRIGDPAHPTEGVLVRVEKTQAKGAQYPSYNLRLGRQPAPADEIIAKMDATEIAALVPLEETIRILSPEEEWACLEKVMAPETVKQIRESL